MAELHQDPAGVPINGLKGRYQPYPVEYKRGRAKEDDCDALQLCAQAICLEEMLVCPIPQGFLYYGETHRRQEILFDEALRGRVAGCLEEMHRLYRRRHTPKAKPAKRCKTCSLENICLPRLSKVPPASRYVQTVLQEEAL